MKKYYKILTLLTIVTGSASASQYAVQLEASKTPQLARFEHLGTHGELYTVAADNGYIRTRLGPYEQKSDAMTVLAQVHNAGFTQAFVAKEQNQSNKTTHSSSNTHSYKNRHNIESVDVKALPAWQKLSTEQQNNVVYLDGALHVKDGNVFTPLSEITK